MRVLYVSGFVEHTHKQDAVDANDAFLAKPFLLRELAEKIRSLLGEARSIWYSGTNQDRAS
jgi:DNA-binding response OmpR family regulator